MGGVQVVNISGSIRTPNFDGDVTNAKAVTSETKDALNHR